MSERPGDTTAALVYSDTDAAGTRLLSCLRNADTGVRWRHATAPMSSPSFPDGTDSLVYLASSRGRGGLPDLDDAAAWLRQCLSEGVSHVVVVSSTQVFVPSERHPGLVGERFRSSGRPRHPVAGLWNDLEQLARRQLEAPDSPRLTILRPVPMPVRGARDFFSALLEGRLAVTLPGHDPSLQILTPGDAAAGISRAVLTRRPGVFHLIPNGAVSLRHALRLCGLVRLPVPRLLQVTVRGLLARTGSAGPADQLDYIRYDWTAAGEAAAAKLGFTPSCSSVDALRLFHGSGALPPHTGARESGTRTIREAGPVASASSVRAAESLAGPGDDPFGMDRAYIAAWSRRLFRFLHDVYWRIELTGLEHVPRHGPVVLVGTHRGFFPWDGIMMLHAMVASTGRYPRFMVHPGLFKFPFFFNFFRKLGGVLACRENADRILDHDGMLGVFPEGVRGAFKTYSGVYRLESFGNAEFIRAAWRHRATIVPFVTVGSAEAMPIVGKIESRRWRRYALWPYIPLSPTLLPVPLPAKWHTRFLSPIRPASVLPEDDLGASAARLSREIRNRMQGAIDEILERRRSVIRGTVFD